MVYYGFYNSKGNDRLYDAKDLGKIFDGIIMDGVYGNIYNQFRVTPNHYSNFSVFVDTGRAWFDHTWIYNDALFSLQVSPPCYVVIEVNETDRVNRIRMVKSLTNTTYLHQYPIAQIGSGNGSASISQAQIVNLVGTTQCPLVTGPLKMMTIDQITAQWQAEWRDFKNTKQTEWTKFLSDKNAYINSYVEQSTTTAMEKLWTSFKQGKDADWNNFKSSRSNEWYTWLNTNTKQYADQWANWFHANTVGKSEKWEAWYDSMTDASEKQWDNWFHDTTDGQLDYWWAWWEEHHELLSSNMIKLWWEWWHPFKDDCESEYTSWWNDFKSISQNNWEVWYSNITSTSEQSFENWWNAHPPIWEKNWEDWWNSHPPLYEETYERWFKGIKQQWDQFQDAAERWFEDFKGENDTRKSMAWYNNLTDENNNQIYDDQGNPITTKNYVVVI